jgi:hypothetical protein
MQSFRELHDAETRIIQMNAMKNLKEASVLSVMVVRRSKRLKGRQD